VVALRSARADAPQRFAVRASLSLAAAARPAFYFAGFVIGSASAAIGFGANPPFAAWASLVIPDLARPTLARNSAVIPGLRRGPQPLARRLPLRSSDAA
jgi:hypothetical protein